jgi:hypothetical protein
MAMRGLIACIRFAIGIEDALIAFDGERRGQFVAFCCFAFGIYGLVLAEIMTAGRK